MLKNIAKYQSQGAKVDRDFTSYLADLHVDYDDDEMKEGPTLYDIAVSNIVELRDLRQGQIRFSFQLMELLFQEAMTHLVDWSTLAAMEHCYKTSLKNKEIPVNCSFYKFLCDAIEDDYLRGKLKEFIAAWSKKNNLGEEVEKVIWDDYDFIIKFIMDQTDEEDHPSLHRYSIT